MKKITNFLNTREAAVYLKMSPRTLRRYRVTGAGPAFYRFGGACALPPQRSRRLGKDPQTEIDRR